MTGSRSVQVSCEICINIYSAILGAVVVINQSTQVVVEVEMVQKIVSVVRSTRADYNIPNKTKTELHLEITYTRHQEHAPQVVLPYCQFDLENVYI